MITQYVQGHQVRLRTAHDLQWADEFGTVFKVFDRLTSGMLGFGTQHNGRRYYLRYAGARTLEYMDTPEAAVDKLRRAARHYLHLRHPALIHLEEIRELPGGILCRFLWDDGVPLGPLNENYALLRAQPLLNRLRMMDALIDLHAALEAQELVAGGLTESHLLYDSAKNTLVLTSIDDYIPFPALNLRGRTPGSPFYLAPECYQKGISLDETTTVYALGALAHLLFGDRAQPGPRQWDASPALYEVARRALQKDREKRYDNTASFLFAWRAAVLHSPFM